MILYKNMTKKHDKNIHLLIYFYCQLYTGLILQISYNLYTPL